MVHSRLGVPDFWHHHHHHHHNDDGATKNSVSHQVPQAQGPPDLGWTFWTTGGDPIFGHCHTTTTTTTTTTVTVPTNRFPSRGLSKGPRTSWLVGIMDNRWGPDFWHCHHHHHHHGDSANQSVSQQVAPAQGENHGLQGEGPGPPTQPAQPPPGHQGASKATYKKQKQIYKFISQSINMRFVTLVKVGKSC